MRGTTTTTSFSFLTPPPPPSPPHSGLFPASAASGKMPSYVQLWRILRGHWMSSCKVGLPAHLSIARASIFQLLASGRCATVVPKRFILPFAVSYLVLSLTSKYLLLWTSGLFCGSPVLCYAICWHSSPHCTGTLPCTVW